MPRCGKCFRELTCAEHGTDTGPNDLASVKCTADCGVIVRVKDSRNFAVAGAKVTVDGAEKETDSLGFAIYDKLAPKEYTAQIALPEGIAGSYDAPDPSTQTATANVGDVLYFLFPLVRRAELTVKVVQRGAAKVFGDATVKVSGKATPPDGTTVSDTGIVSFGPQPAGDYAIEVTLKQEDGKLFAPPRDPVPFTLGADDATATVEVEPINVVTPKIEPEHLLVLLERDLKQHETEDPRKVGADPTLVLISLEQTHKAEHPFTKEATLKCEPENVEVFFDRKCENPVTGKLTNDQLTGDEKLKLWLRGKTAGKFKVSLELDDPADPFVKPAEQMPEVEMGVVKVELEVYQHDATDLDGVTVDPDAAPAAPLPAATYNARQLDEYHTALKDKALPDQKVLAEDAKIEKGRLLHAQSDKNNGRAKLVLKKLTADHLPAGTEDYKITIDETNDSGAVEVFTAEVDGDKKAFPVEVKVQDLTADQTFWVEGKTATAKALDVRLDAGIDAGGPPEQKKRYGDWARFTVVKIDEVKVAYVQAPNEPVQWDDGSHQFFVNLKADPAGRKIEISAKLTEKIEHVKIHFLLAPDPDNGKAANWGKDLPEAWKWREVDASVKHADKADRTKLLHISKETDANGSATVELTLSRAGGDKFTPAAYIDQDPHLAKYVEGHGTLGTRKPTLAAYKVEVSRKFWYQEVQVEGVGVSSVAGAAARFRDIKVVMEAGSALPITRIAANGMNPRVIYPKYMVGYANDNSDALVVGDSNVNGFFGGRAAETDKPVKIPMIVCHAYWCEDGVTGAQDHPLTPASSFPVDMVMDKKNLSPPLQGGTLYVSGTWTAAEWDAVTSAWVNVRSGNLADGDLSIDPGRGGGNGRNTVRVALPASLSGVQPDTHVQIDGVVVQAAVSWLGTYFQAEKYISAVDSPNADYFLDALSHEIGHAFHQVGQNRAAGAPPHGNHYVTNGNHCNSGGNACLMYQTILQPGPRAFCAVCHPYLLTTDISQLW